MTFVGPGSEWLWAALSGIVTAISLLAILRQLRMQQGAAAFEQVDAFMREFFSERLLRHQLVILRALRDGVEPAAVPYGAAAAIDNYLTKIGALARAGRLGLKNLRGTSQIYEAWWATLAPVATRIRADTGLPLLFDDFEWLAGRFAELDRRAGIAIQYDDAYVTTSLPRRIALTEDMLRVEQELRH